MAIELTPVLVTLELVLLVAWVVRKALPLAERLVTVREGLTRRAEAERVDLPADLMQHTARWADPWARESERRRARELYAELGDWDKVREQLKTEEGEE